MITGIGIPINQSKMPFIVILLLTSGVLRE
jgi:hypothetical protein